MIFTKVLPAMNMWSSWLLAALSVLVVWRELAGSDVAGYISNLLLVGFLILGWPRFSPMARLLALVCVGATLLTLMQLASPWATLYEATNSFTFLAAFMTALALLRLPAYRSRLIRRCGQSLLKQPPAWRYPLLSLGSTLFGIVLNFGVLTLFITMIDKANTLASAQGRTWLQEARRRRMLLATLRGFTLAPLVSPLGIGVAVMLGNLHPLTWAELFPYVLVTAIGLFLLGWACDQLSVPQSASHGLSTAQPSLMPLVILSLLLLALISLVFAISVWLSLRLPQAVLIAVPMGAWLWLMWQCRALGWVGVIPASIILGRRLPDVFEGIGNEIVALGSGAYLGYLSVALLNPAQLKDIAEILMYIGNWLPVLAMMLIVLLAQLGVNPIISVTFLTSMVAQAGPAELSLPLLAAAMLAGWSLTMMSSPFTAAMMIMSRFTGMTARQICLSWNGAFLTISLAMAVLLLRLVG